MNSWCTRAARFCLFFKEGNSFTNVVVKGVLNRINKLNIFEHLGKKIKWVNKKPYYIVHQKYKYNWVSTRIWLSFLVHPGWSPGFTVSLSAFGICNIINILRHKILGKRCNILSGSARLESWHQESIRNTSNVFWFWQKTLLVLRIPNFWAPSVGFSKPHFALQTTNTNPEGFVDNLMTSFALM